MVTERLEIRLDPELRRWLEQVADAQGESVSQIVRDAIEHRREELLRQERRQAVEELCAMEIEDVPDPDELSRQLASTYDVDIS